MSSATTRPLLPDDLVKDVLHKSCMHGFCSAVYEEDWRDHRIKCRNWLKPTSPDSYMVYGPRQGGPASGFTADAKRTGVHAAASEGDVLAVYESLRLGAAADPTDKDGKTPLFLALSQLVASESPLAIPLIPVPAEKRKAEHIKTVLRLTWVARILIEQHADVNRRCQRVSILDLACSARNWALIKLLLEHGAQPTSSCSSYLKTDADRNRLATLIKSTPFITRPPRLCPCWSGKSVSDCHTVEQDYSLRFLCVCGSDKSYRRCCYARSHFVKEKWDPVTQRILHDYVRSTNIIAPPISLEHSQSETVRAFNKLYATTAAASGSPISTKTGMASSASREETLKELEQWVSHRLIDPAFFYAATKMNPFFIPQVTTRKSSKHISLQIQTNWNAAVDQYITEGNDDRSRFEIERAAKIGVNNGALIRICEGLQCSNVESSGDNSSRFRQCSKCHISVYCSADCQRSAWPLHKRVCGSDTHIGQMLPSQKAWLLVASAPHPRSRRLWLLNSQKHSILNIFDRSVR